VLGESDNSAGGNPIAYFNSDRGLLDGFRIEYLLIPLFFGVALTLTRRALRKE
jgi:hypothetical protein